MSHFCGIILLPRNTKRNRKHIEGLLNEILDPYNENNDVPEYERACRCIGRQAMEEVDQKLDRKYGNMNEMRNEFWSKRKRNPYPQEKAGISKEKMKKLHEEYAKKEAEDDKAWKKFIKGRIEDGKRMFAKHPLSKKANPECECGGTGKEKSTYNPDSKWDWWVIGGRWTGAFDPKYDPADDPDNLEKCRICNGSGTRKMPVPADPNWKPKKGECNGCGGKGKSLKFSFNDFDGDIMPINKIDKEFIPFCIVTPDGKWHEKGEMGWFATVSEEKTDWDEQARKLLKKNDLCLGVVVDFHI